MDGPLSALSGCFQYESAETQISNRSAILDASEHGRADGQVQGNGGENAKEKQATERRASDAEAAPLPLGDLMHLTEHRGITLQQLNDIVRLAVQFQSGGGRHKRVTELVLGCTDADDCRRKNILDVFLLKFPGFCKHHGGFWAPPIPS